MKKERAYYKGIVIGFGLGVIFTLSQLVLVYILFQSI